MKKYVNYKAIPELEKTSLVQHINDTIESLEKGGNLEKNQQLLERLHKLKKLNDYVSLDWPAVKTVREHYYKYFNYVIKLIEQKKYEEARILCILEIKGLDAYLHSDKNFKYIWPQYIANNRWRKFCLNENWLFDLKLFADLVTDGIVTLEQFLKYPFAFTVIVRLLPSKTGYYKAVLESKKITANQRSDLISFLIAQKIPFEHSPEEVYRLWLQSGASFYHDLLPESHRTNLPPEGGFDFVLQAAKSKRAYIVEQLKSCPRVFKPTEKGVYPIEFIMVWKVSRKKWARLFARWHNEDHWKQDNLHLLNKRLKKIKLDEDSAFYFYVTMDYHTEDMKLFHGMRRGLQQQHNDTSMFPLSELPIDIIHIISKHLTLTSVMALTLTCKSINQTIKMNGETFWKQSLLITCPRVKFNSAPSKWRDLATKELRLQQNLIKGTKQTFLQPNVQDCTILDENWGIFEYWSPGGRERTLFNCNTRTLEPINLTIEPNYYNYLFLDSQPNVRPTIVYIYSPYIYIQKDKNIVKQRLPVDRLYNVIGLDSRRIFCDNFIWDIEKATQTVKFDLDQESLQYCYYRTCNKQYDERSSTLMLVGKDKFYTIDVRSGLPLCHNLQMSYFDILDDYTLGYIHVAENLQGAELGTLDLRMMRKDVIHTSKIYANANKILLSGIAGKALIKRDDGLVVQWDFRERLWDRVFFQPGHLLNMNSKQIITNDSGLCVNDFRC